MQLTILVMDRTPVGRRSELLDQHLGTSLPVVHVAPVRGKVVDAGFNEAPLEEPVHGTGGQHEQALDAHAARALLDPPEQALAVALALGHAAYREAGHL